MLLLERRESGRGVALDFFAFLIVDAADENVGGANLFSLFHHQGGRDGLDEGVALLFGGLDLLVDLVDFRLVERFAVAIVLTGIFEGLEFRFQEGDGVVEAFALSGLFGCREFDVWDL